MWCLSDSVFRFLYALFKQFYTFFLLLFSTSCIHCLWYLFSVQQLFMRILFVFCSGGFRIFGWGGPNIFCLGTSVSAHLWVFSGRKLFSIGKNSLTIDGTCMAWVPPLYPPFILYNVLLIHLIYCNLLLCFLFSSFEKLILVFCYNFVCLSFCLFHQYFFVAMFSFLINKEAVEFVYTA